MTQDWIVVIGYGIGVDIFLQPDVPYQIFSLFMSGIWSDVLAEFAVFKSRVPGPRGICLESEPSLWPGSGLNFSLIIHANCSYGT